MVGRSWERFGAVSGLLFMAAVIASFTTPETPDGDDPTPQIVQAIADDRNSFILSAYLGLLASLFFIVFTAALWSRLRRAEPGSHGGASILTLLGGLGSSIIIILANAGLLALVFAADEGREPEAVRALFELDETLFLGVGITSAAFYGGVALSSPATRSLPAWLYWPAAALAVVFPLALIGVFSEEDEGGVLGGIFFIALLVNFLWILATSILMVRAGGAEPGEGAAAAPPPGAEATPPPGAEATPPPS